MPGVQDNYSIDVTNRFGFTADVAADSGSDDGIENVDPFEMINELKKQAENVKKVPKPKVNKKKVVATPPPVEAEVKKTEGEKKPERGGGAKRGEGRGGGRGRGDGRPRQDRPPREPRQGGEAGADGAPREDRPRRGGRGGSDRGRGGPRRGDGERRTFDRKSADPRTTVKGTDKREGAGSGNWGTAEDDLKAQTETVVADKPAEDKAADGKTEEKVEEAKPEPEVEANTMTLEEYRKGKKAAVRNPNAKAADKPAEKKPVAKKEHAAKGRAARVEAVDYTPAPLVQRGGGRGGRRGGRGGGDRRGGDRKPQETALDLNAAEEFPTLG